jgi:hypothetical protein
MINLKPVVQCAYPRRPGLYDLKEVYVYIFGLKHPDVVWLAVKMAMAVTILAFLVFCFSTYIAYFAVSLLLVSCCSYFVAKRTLELSSELSFRTPLAEMMVFPKMPLPRWFAYIMNAGLLFLTLVPSQLLALSCKIIVCSPQEEFLIFVSLFGGVFGCNNMIILFLGRRSR